MGLGDIVGSGEGRLVGCFVGFGVGAEEGIDVGMEDSWKRIHYIIVVKVRVKGKEKTERLLIYDFMLFTYNKSWMISRQSSWLIGYAWHIRR